MVVEGTGGDAVAVEGVDGGAATAAPLRSQGFGGETIWYDGREREKAQGR